MCCGATATLVASGIGEGFSWLGDKLPIVSVRGQHEFQNAKSIGVANLAIRFRDPKRAVALASCAHDKLSDPMGTVALPVRILRREQTSLYAIVHDYIN